MSKRRTTRGRGQARRDNGGNHGFIWFGAGMVSGLALATYAWFSGLLPPHGAGRSGAEQNIAQQAPITEVAPAQNNRDYDFYTVLPEMEVVVPKQEISERASAANTNGKGPYFLQVGSFRGANDAESQKAKLALLGVVANVQAVTVNGGTWHRVRVGPVDSARETDAMRRRLEDSGFEAMVLRGQ